MYRRQPVFAAVGGGVLLLFASITFFLLVVVGRVRMLAGMPDHFFLLIEPTAHRGQHRLREGIGHGLEHLARPPLGRRVTARLEIFELHADCLGAISPNSTDWGSLKALANRLRHAGHGCA